jgi:hypothetical protein
MKVSKFSKTGDLFSSYGAYHARAVPVNNVPTSTTRDASLGYLLGCILINKCTLFKKPWNSKRVPSNFAGKLIFGSLIELLDVEPCYLSKR